MMAVIRNYCHYSEEQLLNLSLDHMGLDYYFAIKAREEQAKMTAAYSMMSGIM